MKKARLRILVVEKPTIDQQRSIRNLQKIAFPGVSDEEAKEDFYRPASVQVLPYIGRKLVGWAGVFETEQSFAGKRIKIGGYGICTHPDYQGIGIASEVSKRAMDYLQKKGIDIAFLSVEPTNVASVRTHTKNGFVALPREFAWTNSKGELKKDVGGMIASVNSSELFNLVLNGTEPFYVGDGYW